MLPMIPVLVSSVILLWSLHPIAQKYVMRSIASDEFVVVTGLVYFACVVLYVIGTRMRLGDVFAKLSLIDRLLILFVGSLSYFASSLLYSKLMQLRDSHWVVAITYATPVLLTTMFAILFLREQPSPKTIAGILLMSSGVLLLTI